MSAGTWVSALAVLIVVLVARGRREDPAARDGRLEAAERTWGGPRSRFWPTTTC